MKYKSVSIQPEVNKAEQYLTEETSGLYNFLIWWKVNQTCYPVLVRLVKDFYEVQIEEVKTECQFN